MVHRQLSINAPGGPPRPAGRRGLRQRFGSLADPTRTQILHLLATADGPMTVGQIVQQVGVGQSTVSHHLKVLAQVRFVTVEHAGTSSRHQVNPHCLAAFPTAADADRQASRP